MVIPSLTKLMRKVNITDNRHPARYQGPKRQPSSPDIFQGSGYRLLGITINRGGVPICTNPCDILQPPGLRRAGHPSEECGCPIEFRGPAHHISLRPLHPPRFHFGFFLVSSGWRGKIRRQFILETVGPCVGFPSRLC